MPPLHEALDEHYIPCEERYPGFQPHAFATATKQDLGSNKAGFAVFSKRSVIVGTHPLYVAQESRKRPNERQTFGIAELAQRYFNCMCVGSVPDDNDDVNIQPFQDNTSHKEKIIYPIAKYPGRLNSPYLVETRRRSLAKDRTFQPVHIE